MIQAIVFSMDRAMQCESLLQSMDDMCTGLDLITVIYRATSPLHALAYHRMMGRLSKTPTLYVSELDGNLASLLNEAVRVRGQKGSFVCLHVDDQIYFRPADFSLAEEILKKTGAFVWSWRLGAPLHTKSTKWWAHNGTQDRDYGYLWHSDGAMYRRENYLYVLDIASPGWPGKSNQTPNHIETIGALHKDLWRNYVHIGPIDQCCMTWQINKESSTEGRFGAPWATTEKTQLDVLAQAFLDEKRVQNKMLYEDDTWTKRFQKADSIPTHVHACREASEFYASVIR